MNDIDYQQESINAAKGLLNGIGLSACFWFGLYWWLFA
jgi:hypothetical protein